MSVSLFLASSVVFSQSIADDNALASAHEPTCEQANGSGGGGLPQRLNHSVLKSSSTRDSSNIFAMPNLVIGRQNCCITPEGVSVTPSPSTDRNPHGTWRHAVLTVHSYSTNLPAKAAPPYWFKFALRMAAWQAGNAGVAGRVCDKRDGFPKPCSVAAGATCGAGAATAAIAAAARSVVRTYPATARQPRTEEAYVHWVRSTPRWPAGLQQGGRRPDAGPHRAGHGAGLQGQARAHLPRAAGGLGLELPAAHHAALHGGTGDRGGSPAAGKAGGAAGGDRCAAPRPQG